MSARDSGTDSGNVPGATTEAPGAPDVPATSGLARKTLMALGIGAFGSWAAASVYLYRVQDRAIFPMPDVELSTLKSAAAEAGVRQIEVLAEDGTRLYGWHLPAVAPQDRADRRAILYFHGNASSVQDAVFSHGQRAQAGWDVVSIHYRGYPGSQGAPGEEGIRLDAKAAWRFVTEDLGIEAGRVIVHGRSLGGGVALPLAAQMGPGGLVLESTFTALIDVVKGRHPWLPASLALRHPFRSHQYVEDLRCPTLILHGDQDRVIGVEHGRALAERIEGAEYLELPGVTHSGLLNEAKASIALDRFVESSVPATRRR